MRWFQAIGSRVVMARQLVFAPRFTWVILVFVLPAGVAAQQPDPPPCVTWEGFQAQFEGKMIQRAETPPPPFFTGILIRFAGDIRGSRPIDSASAMEAARRFQFFIGSVICGSPAAATGLRSGDEILSVNGKPPYMPGVLIALQGSSRAGDLFRLRVRRGEKIMAVTVESARRPKEMMRRR